MFFVCAFHTVLIFLIVFLIYKQTVYAASLRLGTFYFRQRLLHITNYRLQVSI